MRRASLGLAGVLFLFAAGPAAAQNQGQATTIIQTPPAAQPDPPVQTSMGPMKASTANHHDVKVNVLSTDTFVVVKDVGDSQVVMVYRVDQFGKVSLVHKARFFY